MTQEYFMIVCDLFKIYKLSDNDFIRRIVDTFKEDCFYGCIERESAERLIKDQESTHFFSFLIPTYYIVRYARSKRLTITYKKKDQKDWNHCIIEPFSAMKENGYSRYFSRYQKEHQLETFSDKKDEFFKIFKQNK